MIVVRDRFGQLEPAISTAAEAPATSPFIFYLVAVAAGVTVYLITRTLDKRKRR